MNKAIALCVLVAVTITFSCQEKRNDGANKFSDPVLIKIYDLKDRRLADSLYQYFTSPNEKYREEAVLAFASIQDSTGISALGKMLQDESGTRSRSSSIFDRSDQIIVGRTIPGRIAEDGKR